MVLNTWHRGSPSTHFGSSVVGTAWFLWIIGVLGFLLALAAGVAMLVGSGEEDCDHRAGPFKRIECTHSGEPKRAGKADDVRHAATVPVEAQPEYVHEVTP